ncbi:MAG: NAD(P)H-binding protein [Sandaracinaceae bacterium]
MAEQLGFVAGATGLTGRSVVEILRERGLGAIAHVRPDSSRLEAWRSRFEAMGAEVDTTPWDEDALTETLRERAPQLVFALLGTTKRRARRADDPSAETYEAVDYGLTAMLRRAAERCGHRPRFVYLSSMGVKEGTSNAYLAARARIEKELREGALPWTSVRPSFIVGDRDEARAGEAIGSTVADGLLGALGALGARRLRDRYRSITGPELARARVSVGLDPAREDQVVEADALRSTA